LKSPLKPLVRSIQLEKETIPYSLIYSNKARYLRIQIKIKGEIEVILPPGFQVADAESVMQQKHSWIKKRLELIKRTENRFYLLGHEIKVTQNYDLFIKRHKISIKDHHLKIISPSGAIEDTVTIYNTWLRKLAKKSLVARVHTIADNLNFEIGRISIRGQKTRWGSCSKTGNLSFNYNLLKFRKEVVDYVIIHELCHLKQMNHSEKFWKLVAGFSPNYKKLRKELRDSPGPV
jgi:predicted metal-dependent hydrolase